MVLDKSPPRCSLVGDISSLVAEKGFGSLRAPIGKVTCPIGARSLRFQLELRQKPMVACFCNDIKEQCLFHTFNKTGVPIIVTRRRDGDIHALLEVCLHRGWRLVREAGGKTNLFTHWFHGWYANDELLGCEGKHRWRVGDRFSHRAD